MKKIITIIISILTIIMIGYSINDIPPFTVSEYDLNIYRLSNIIISLSLLIPFLIVNNKKILKKLKLITTNKSISFLIIFVSLLVLGNSFDSLHTEEYRINYKNYKENSKNTDNNNNNNNNNNKEPILDNNNKEPNNQNNNTLKVHYIDVGQGDSIFVELPNNETMLIDASEYKYSNKIINYIKKLGYNKINYIIGTHPHSDHIGGLSDVIKPFEIDKIYMPRKENNTKTYENLLTTIKNKNLKITTAKKGVEIINKDELKAIIISPTKDNYKSLNDYSAVIKITYINNSFLFMGDAEKLIENEITDNVSSDVIKIGHHGSSSSSNINFLKKVNPKYAIISVGSNNTYNHPHKETINTLNKLNINTLRTDINGTIIITSDGNNLLVEKEK